MYVVVLARREAVEGRDRVLRGLVSLVVPAALVLIV